MRASPQTGRASRPEGRREVVKGAVEQVILVRVPVPGVFREAVFFLHEDYLRRGDLKREELLRQARQSAEDYLRPCLPPRPAGRRWPYVLCLLLGALIGFGLCMILK